MIVFLIKTLKILFNEIAILWKRKLDLKEQLHMAIKKQFKSRYENNKRFRF